MAGAAEGERTTRICLDANCIAPGLTSEHGSSSTVVDLLEAGIHRLVLSDEIEAEFVSLVTKPDIIRLLARRRTEPAAFSAAVQRLMRAAERVTPVGVAPPCRDEADRKYLHCAAAARVDFLVSYDADLLALGEVEGIPIVTPAELLRRTGV